MKQNLARLQQWYSARERREQIILGIGAAIVGVTLLYLLIWEPVAKAHAHRVRDLDSARDLAIKIESLAGQAGNGAVSAQHSNASLLSAVDQATKSGVLNKPVTRLQPEGDTEVRVWFDAVSFDALMRWVAQLRTSEGIVVKTAQIEKGQTAGTVNAQLSLTRP